MGGAGWCGNLRRYLLLPLRTWVVVHKVSNTEAWSFELFTQARALRLVVLELARVARATAVLVSFLEKAHVDAHRVAHACARQRAAPNRQPAPRRKIGALRDVEAVVEPCVVRAREGQDEVARTLDHLDKRDAVLAEKLRGEEQFLVPKELPTLLEEVRRVSLCKLLKAVARRRRDEVPRLWRTRVEVVDAIKVVVLRVISKDRTPRTKVEVLQGKGVVVVQARELGTTKAAEWCSNERRRHVQVT